MIEGALVLDALAAALSNLVGGLMLAAAVATAVVLIGLEARREKRLPAKELEQEPELISAWDGFPPRWQPPEAETHLGKTRVGEDRPGRRAA